MDISAKGDPTQSTFSGSYRKSAYNLKKFYVRDIFPVVRSSLSSHIFSALVCFWNQIRGAGIGSQISPSLSNLAATIVERTWQQIYLETLNQPRFAFFGIRYVDNRFSIATEEAKLHPGFLALCDLDFYGHPVELEVVDDDLLWGFSVDVHQRTVQYRQSDLRQIRDCVSAGSVRLRMSGLKSRAQIHLPTGSNFCQSFCASKSLCTERFCSARRVVRSPHLNLCAALTEPLLWRQNGLRVRGRTLFLRASRSS